MDERRGPPPPPPPPVTPAGSAVEQLAQRLAARSSRFTVGVVIATLMLPLLLAPAAIAVLLIWLL